MNTNLEIRIRKFEASARCKLPQAYTGFLGGDYGDAEGVLREDCAWASDSENLDELTKQAKEFLAEYRQPFKLAENDFVFVHQGDRFLYFSCNGNSDDPPVWGYVAGEPAPKQVFAHFSEWVTASQPEDHPGVERPEQQEKPSDAVQAFLLDISEYVSPELKAELRRVEARFPARLAEAQRVVSWPLGAFRSATANLVAGIILGTVLLVLGAAVLAYGVYLGVETKFHMPLAAPHGLSWLVWVAMIWLSAGLAGGGGYFVYRARQLLGSRLIVAAHGLSWVRSSKAEPVAWHEIWKVEEVILHESLPLNTLLRFLLPKSKSRQFVVHTKDGRRFTFSANSIREIDLLRAILERVASDLEIPWRVVQTTI